jgi:hypothetical protein
LTLLGRSEEDLENEIKHMKVISKDINMNFGLENGAKICYKKKYSQRKMYVGHTFEEDWT